MNVENRNVNPNLINNIEALRTAINEISVYDLNTYTAIELYYRIANKLNEVINELLKHEIAVSEQVIEQNECLQYLLNEGLREQVINKINSMVDDGTMDTIINHNIFNELSSKIKEITYCVTPEMFGAEGDGVTDDTQAFKNCFEFAITNSYVVKIGKGTYNINSDEEWICPKIISDGGIINLTGSLRFLFNDNIELKGFTINYNENGGSGVDDNPTRGYLFKPNNINQKIDYAILENITINGIVQCEKRITGGLRINECNNFIKIENIQGKNIGGLISLLGSSKNITVKNVIGENIETLVQAQGGYNCLYENLKINNSKKDYSWWIGKNCGVNYNGKDTLLIEGGNDVIIRDIYGKYCIERPIYCQASNVNAYNLQSYDTGCLKFVGSYDGTKKVENIFIDNVYIFSSEDNSRDGWGQIYGCKNIVVNNLKIDCINSSTRNNYFIGVNDEITFNNLDINGISNSLFSKTGGKVKKMTINNCKFKSNENVLLDGLLFIKNSNYTNADVIENLIIDNFKSETGENYSTRTFIKSPSTNPVANNIIVKNSEIDSTNSTIYSIFAFEDLNNLSVENVINKNKLSISSIVGSNLYEKLNYQSNNIFKMKVKKEDIDNKILCTLNFEKNNKNNDYVLKYLKDVEFTKCGITDYSIELPIKNEFSWKIKIESKTAGISEYLMNGNTITEICKSSELFNITTYPNTPSANKVNIFVNTDKGFLTVRDRIANDNFHIKVSKICDII